MENKRIIKIYILLAVIIIGFILIDTVSNELLILFIVFGSFIVNALSKFIEHGLYYIDIHTIVALLIEVRYADNIIDKIIRIPIIILVFIIKYGLVAIFIIAGIKLLEENIISGIVITSLGGIFLYIYLRNTLLLYNTKKEEIDLKNNDKVREK